MNADLIPDDPIELDPSDYELNDHEPDADEPDEPSDLDFTEMPCTDEAGQGSDESQWEAFLPDDDEWDPEPDPGDFWIEGILDDTPVGTLQFSLPVALSPSLFV